MGEVKSIASPAADSPIIKHVAILAEREPCTSRAQRSVNGNPPEASAPVTMGLTRPRTWYISPSNHAASPLQEMNSSTCLHATNHPGPTLQLRLSQTMP